jgi:hypothetical protein
MRLGQGKELMGDSRKPLTSLTSLTSDHGLTAAGARQKLRRPTAEILVPATAPNPISLTDEQLSTVMKAAEPLDPHRRSAFLAALAQMLRGEPQPVGDGSLGRAIRKLQPEFHDSMGVSSLQLSQTPRSRRKVGEALA